MYGRAVFLSFTPTEMIYLIYSQLAFIFQYNLTAFSHQYPYSNMNNGHGLLE
ncbi:hypothetical protein BDW02DRAFT_572210 [Decorospora gaudefroyi]|uniref:Uncharacterized protein n=1 Tax=Decorospora gaudefroyi TaxID=184978 RepID=A0A6A5K4P8_9PLEO|nr:hypothetical protein BDW02DRAFT_572210 [Decorospora gaudefroyi]